MQDHQQPQDTEYPSPPATWHSRAWRCVQDAIPSALKTARWMLAITLPLALLVQVLKVIGALTWIAGLFAPLFACLGLPGEASLVFITAALLNIYSAIAVIATIGFDSRTITILALMCLISHNMPMETAIQRKTGSSAAAMLTVRLTASLAAALALNLLLPATPPPPALAAVGAAVHGEWAAWTMGIGRLALKIMVLITLLMILERLLDEFGVTRLLTRILRYPLALFGIPREAAFLWVVANTLGLAYGGGVIVDHVSRGRLTRQQADRLNYHIAISHSLLEDTMLFVAIGVSVWWITLPRLVLAGIAVWLKRLADWSRVTRAPAVRQRTANP